MSVGYSSRQHRGRSVRSTISMSSSVSRQGPSYAASRVQDDLRPPFEPFAATASFVLYGQGNEILVLHHDTLKIERRVRLHGEHILWVVADNVSERGSGRLAVSFDTGKTAIIWDILTGKEMARFSSYEEIRAASFMRNGNIAFGNDQGNMTIFEPATSEHVSVRTIFDPITAIAPAADCTTFAIGYMNGSLLIATLQPVFSMVHTLNTNRAPSRITNLAWHGSSSKSTSDMLAAQTADADLRVWSVPRSQQGEPPSVIRVLQRAENQQSGPCWCAWSKSGRIIQYSDGETRCWDVRTKKVTYEVIPVIDGVAGITNYGHSATVFALGLDHMVHQYDIDPTKPAMEVASAQHAPARSQPTPPNTLEGRNRQPIGSSYASGYTDTESSADESVNPTPLRKLIDGGYDHEAEARDVIMPLSPSSRASSISSRSSGRRSNRSRRYLYDRPDSSRASSHTGIDDGATEFSYGPGTNVGRDNMSIRTGTSRTSVAQSVAQSRASGRGSRSRQETTRTPQPRASAEPEDTTELDLFPYASTRMRQVALRTPHYGNVTRTPELLQREMLSVVFGWNDDVESLIREEMSRHRAGSAAAILLAKWLGEAPDSMASMIGSQSMSSSDWMILALSSLGAETQKKVSEAFVQRLLEKGDIHPAVAVLLGVGENLDAIEIYVSRKLWLEAVILTCYTCPSDWQRICYMIKKWGEAEVLKGNAELAVRCFSCAAVETSEPWFSPRAQDAAYTAQQARLTDQGPRSGDIASPLSPESARSSRLTAMNASLKLITRFGNERVPAPSQDELTTRGGVVTAIGMTPLAQGAPWRRPQDLTTAIPTTRKKRLPSRSDIDRLRRDTNEMEEPMTAARDTGSRAPSRTGRHSRLSSTSSVEPSTAIRPTMYDEDNSAPHDNMSYLPPPAKGAFNRPRGDTYSSRDKKPDGLNVKILHTELTAPNTNASNLTADSAFSMGPLTGASAMSARGRAGGEAISSLAEARAAARSRAESRKRDQSRKRTESRSGRASSRARQTSVKPGKRSPSSPVPMSPEEFKQASQPHRGEPVVVVDEDFYRRTSPTESHRSTKAPGLSRRESNAGAAKASGKAALISSLAPIAIDDGRGRSQNRDISAAPRSPSLPLLSSKRYGEDDSKSAAGHFRMRARSSSRQPGDDLQSRRNNKRDPSRGRGHGLRDDVDLDAQDDFRAIGLVDDRTSDAWETTSLASKPGGRRLARRGTAAEELEARRRSLARRPSAPAIPLPGDTPSFRPGMSPRSYTDLGDSPSSLQPLARSATVDPEQMNRHGAYPSKVTGTSTTSAPIGLPATPRAMRHPKYMGSDTEGPNGSAPPVPEIPGRFNELTPGTSNAASSFTNALLSMQDPDDMPPPGADLTQSVLAEQNDAVGPLLPATVFGQKVMSPMPPRSASTPPEQTLLGFPPYNPNSSAGSAASHVKHLSSGRQQARQISPPDSQVEIIQVSNMDGAFHGDDEIVVVPNRHSNEQIPPPPPPPPPPIMLPELQHLAGPPADPIASGMISIAIDEQEPVIDVQSLPQPMHRAATADPYTQQRHRAPSADSFGSRMRNIGDRMRSSSKSRTTNKFSPAEHKPLPYETALPSYEPAYQNHSRHESLQRAKSPYEQDMAAQAGHQGFYQPLPPPPPPPVRAEQGLNETSIPPSSLPTRSASSTGYRNPREIRANMPPETLQATVFRGYNAGGFL